MRNAAKRPILVVDDDVDIREALTEALEDHGFGVTTAANGLEALEALRSAPHPCIVLLDLMMPLMDGYGFLAEHESDPSISGIPVAIVTAGNSIERHRLGRAVQVVQKPVRLGQLLDLLEQMQSDAGQDV